MAKNDLTAQRLREALHYNPETGVFTRLICTSRRSAVGAIAGTLSRGYCSIGIDGNNYRAHRLAWLYMTGSWPSDQIDHINGVRDDNRWINLRDVSGSTNLQNRRHAQRNNACGLLGVSPYRKVWRATIRVGKKMLHIGTFRTPELAHAAYLAVKRQRHAGCVL